MTNHRKRLLELMRERELRRAIPSFDDGQFMVILPSNGRENGTPPIWSNSGGGGGILIVDPDRHDYETPEGQKKIQDEIRRKLLNKNDAALTEDAK